MCLLKLLKGGSPYGDNLSKDHHPTANIRIIAHVAKGVTYKQGWHIMYNELVYLFMPRLLLCVALENSIMMRHL